MTISAIDHIQLAIPVGAEDQARAFYIGILGFSEVEKPDYMKARGGLWLKSGAVNLHMGVEADFRPAQKAHPALIVDDIAGYEDKLREAGHEIKPDRPVPGFIRFSSHDCFGNRLEFMQVEPE